MKATLALGLMFSFNFTALANDFDCTDSVDGESKNTLRVPQNATCTLNGTQVEGNIKVETNATLYAFNVHVRGNIKLETNATLNVFNIRVDGDIQAEKASHISVFPGSSVGGKIQVVQSYAANIDGVEIGSDLSFHENTHLLKVTNNIIGGNLEAFKNTGGISIISNTIKNNIECQENVFTPTGGGNTVNGNMKGQCENLDGSPPSPEDDCCSLE